MTAEEKQKELSKLRVLNLATLDYNLSLYNASLPQGVDLSDHFHALKNQVEQYFQAGKLTLLRRWFEYFTEGFREAGLKDNLEYSRYIKEKTGYDVDVLQSFHNRINKVLSKGKITTENQYREVHVFVNELSQTLVIDEDKINKLNFLLSEYINRKA